MRRAAVLCTLLHLGCSSASAGVDATFADTDADGVARDASAADSNAADSGAADSGAADSGIVPMDAAVTDAGVDPCAGGPPPSFRGLGDLVGGSTRSIALGISRDGTTVVGQSNSSLGPEAFRWQAGTGMLGLGALASGSFGSIAYAVSGDGSVVAGTSKSALVDCPGRSDAAFRWTAASGLVGLDDLAMGCFFSYAYGISVDGTLIVGGGTNALANTAAVWSNGAWTDLGLAQGLNNTSSLNAITPDRRYVVGTHRVDDGASYNAIRWSEADAEEILGDLGGGATFADATGISDDGAAVIGAGTSTAGVEAFLWRATTGLVGLGDFSGGAFESHAAAISPDGLWIVGQGTSASGPEAAVWQDGGPITQLSALLPANNVTVPAGWTLTGVTGVTTSTGAVIFSGNGTNPSGAEEAWIARICVGR